MGETRVTRAAGGGRRPAESADLAELTPRFQTPSAVRVGAVQVCAGPLAHVRQAATAARRRPSACAADCGRRGGRRRAEIMRLEATRTDLPAHAPSLLLGTSSLTLCPARPRVISVILAARSAPDSEWQRRGQWGSQPQPAPAADRPGRDV